MADLIGQRLGNYEILSLLGEGGMAAVYRARQLNIKRAFATRAILSTPLTRLYEREDWAVRFASARKDDVSHMPRGVFSARGDSIAARLRSTTDERH